MFITDKGVLFPSRPVTWSNNGRASLDLSFLFDAMASMRAPVVREILLHGNFDISGVTGGFDNEDACMLYSQILIRDKGGVIYDLPGKLARLDHQMEIGAAGSEIDGLADAASAATTTGDNFLLRIPFDKIHAHVGSDTALPLLHLTDGGRVEFTFGTPTNATGVSGTVVAYFLVHDEKVRELKARVVRTQLSVAQKKDHYPIDGSIRSLVLCSNPTTQGYSPYTASTYTALNVPEFRLSSFPSYVLREEYRRLRPDFDSADEIIAGNGIPLVVPSSGQRIDKMPDERAVTIDLGTSTIPTSAVLYKEVIEDRDPVLAAQWLGFSDVGSFMNAVKERGVVALGGGRKVRVSSGAVNSVHARRLPMQFE